MKLIDQVLYRDNLADAWLDVAEGSGAAGVDRVSVRRWRRNWEERLVELRRAVKGNSYRPAKIRRFSVPKKSGGVRRLSILTVTDRVLQRAVLNVLDDIFERRFLDCSYGFRPGRSVLHAVEAILVHRNNGLEWVLDADIDNCFESLDHGVLAKLVAQRIDDPIVLRLIDQWLLAGRPDPQVACGIPLGAVISPLLSNVYLHQLDLRLTELGWDLVRYADDWCVFCRTEIEAKLALKEAGTILSDLKLRFEPSKTAITHFDRGFQFLGVAFYRGAYSYLWQGKRIEVEGDVPDWLWGHMPDGYR